MITREISYGAFLLIALSFSSNPGFAQTATTKPGAVMEINVAAKGYTYIGLPVCKNVVYRGRVSSVSGSSISFPGTPFTPGAFATTSIATEQVPQFYIEILSGVETGSMISILTNTSSSLTLAENVASFVAQNEVVQIRPMHTLNSLFPAGAPLRGGTSQTSADEVIVYDAAQQRSFSHFFSTSTKKWMRGTVDNGKRSILPNQSIYIYRKTVATKVRIPGDVKTGVTGIDILPGNNLVPNPYPVSFTLQQANLVTGSVSTGLLGGTSATAADQVTIYGPGLAPRTYFYHSGSAEWRTGTTPSNNVVIPVGASLLINRRSPSPAFTWLKTQPF
jgi:uncharacterized protein (TIGR02597 family)